MAGETIITVVGNAVADPELRFLNSGDEVVNFRIASNSSYYNKNTGQWEDKGTLFIYCEAWRAQANNIVETVRKGMRLIVKGELVVENYDKKDGTTGTSIKLKNAEVGVSLKYAKAQVQSTSHVSYQGNQNQGNFGQRDYGANQGGFGEQGGYSDQQGSNAGDQWGQSTNSSFDSSAPPPF